MRGRSLRALERYAEETGVALVSERRAAGRRTPDDRRIRETIGRFRSVDRRTIHNHSGRRVAERRAATVPVTSPSPLPRRLRSHADQIRFIEPLEISPGHVEDVLTARLVVCIQGGEQELFRTLYRRWFDRVYTYARANLGSSMLAELATQDVFAELHDALPRHQVDSERFRAWFAGIVCRRVQGHLIALHGPEALAEEDPPRATAGVPHAVPSWVTDADLQVLVSRLPLPQRRVAMLRYLMALSQMEVADVVERSVDAVADLHASALSIVAERQLAIGKPSEASSVRFAMARRRRSARVLQSRRLALIPS
jgi:DNA-directed RNA polymerase specialized sigma24 family protein